MMIMTKDMSCMAFFIIFWAGDGGGLLGLVAFEEEERGAPRLCSRCFAREAFVTPAAEEEESKFGFSGLAGPAPAEGLGLADVDAVPVAGAACEPEGARGAAPTVLFTGGILLLRPSSAMIAGGAGRQAISGRSPAGRRPAAL
jgi:hypothetical protein